MSEETTTLIQNISFYLAILSSIATIISSGIVAYLFFFQKSKISGLYRLLQNYSQQITLSDLRAKLNYLQKFTIKKDSTDKDEVVNLLSEIIGQIRGNRVLRDKCKDLLKKLEQLTKDPEKLTESRKRVVGHELHEVIRHLNMDAYKDLLPKGKKNG